MPMCLQPCHFLPTAYLFHGYNEQMKMRSWRDDLSRRRWMICVENIFLMVKLFVKNTSGSPTTAESFWCAPGRDEHCDLFSYHFIVSNVHIHISFSLCEHLDHIRGEKLSLQGIEWLVCLPLLRLTSYCCTLWTLTTNVRNCNRYWALTYLVLCWVLYALCIFHGKA